MNFYLYFILTILFFNIGCVQKQSQNDIKVSNNYDVQTDDLVAKIKEKLTKEPDNAELVLKLGNLYREKSQYYEELYVKTLKSGQNVAPLNLNFSLLLVQYYFNKHQCEPVMDEAMKIIAVNDTYPTVHDLMAQCYFRQGFYPEAVQELEKAINILQSGKSSELSDKESKEAAIKSFQNDIENYKKINRR